MRWSMARSQAKMPGTSQFPWVPAAGWAQHRLLPRDVLSPGQCWEEEEGCVQSLQPRCQTTSHHHTRALKTFSGVLAAFEGRHSAGPVLTCSPQQQEART